MLVIVPEVEMLDFLLLDFVSEGHLKRVYPPGGGINNFELKPVEKKWKEEMPMTIKDFELM